MLAVVGPTGSGKSTFLDSISGRIRRSSLEGSILVNGVDMPKDFNQICAYVMQDDTLFPTLTVKETLMFSAKLRLPSSMSVVEKKQRVEGLISLLGLSNCAQSRVGDEKARGISGGEKRRCSIGIDLIHDPLVMFLDEPTSGLDSTSALNVVEVLKNLTREKSRTVVLTIHQPSFRILDTLDSLLILAKGSAVYKGLPSELFGYFEDIGRKVPEHANVLEVALDILEEFESDPKAMALLITNQQRRDRERGNIAGNAVLPATAKELVVDRKIRHGFWGEFCTLFSRDWLNTIRSQTLTVSRISVMVIMGLTIGTLFFKCPLSDSGASNRISVLAFVVAVLCYNTLDALPVFLQHRTIFVRESSQGAYRTLTHVLASMAVPLPIFFVLALILAICTYWLSGLVRTFSAFCFFVFTAFLIQVTATSYVTMWSAIMPNYYAASGVAGASFSFFFLFSGFFLTRDEIPKYWLWLHYFNLFKYPLENLMWNEFTPLRDTCFAFSSYVQGGRLYQTCIETGESILQDQDVGNVNPWLNSFILVAFNVIFRLGFFFALRRRSDQIRK